MKRSRWILLLALMDSLAAVGLARGAEEMPLYKFKIGQELVYQSRSELHSAQQAIKETESSTFWVTRLNRNGSWHIVVLRKESEHEAQSHFTTFDLTADGREAGKSDEAEVEPPGSRLFFPLPSHLAEAQQGWEVTESEASQMAYQLKTAPSSPAGQWVFEGAEKGMFQAIYLMTYNQTVYFDGARGLVEKIEMTFHQGYGFVGEGRGLVKLESTTLRDPGWMTQFVWESDVCMKAHADVAAALKSLKTGVNEGEAKGSAKAILQTAQDRVKLPVTQEEIQSELKQLDSSFQYAAAEEQKRDAVLNKAAASWVTTDLDGHKHALEDYRGNVVALDFWYRGCGWCLRSMPQIKALAEQFRSQPVVILGMNTDQDEKDARFVVDKLQLNYLTLKAAGLPEKYHAQGFPTFLVIDKQGIVRARHVGYSLTLGDEMARTIERLLKEGTVAQKPVQK